MSESALEWQLKLLQWQLFATLTWDSVEETTVTSRRAHVRRWMSWWGSRMQRKIDQIAYAIRWERGEIGDRPHCHLLIADLPDAAIHLTTCFRLKNGWKRGVSQVRLYDPHGVEVDYMTKGKFGREWAQGANAYELKKFNARDLDALFISPRAEQLMLAKRTTTSPLVLRN